MSSATVAVTVRDNDNSIALGDVMAGARFSRKYDATGSIYFKVVGLSLDFHHQW